MTVTTAPPVNKYDLPADLILPRLDLDLIKDIVKWAELGERAEQMPEYRGWGTWYQGAWGRVFSRVNRPVEFGPKIKPDSKGGVCGTSFCIAGQAATQAGYRLNYTEAYGEVLEEEDYLSVNTCVPQQPTDRVNKLGFTIWEDIPDAEPKNISAVGRRALGLTPDEANALFDGSNSLVSVKEWANLFADVRGLPIPFEDAVIRMTHREVDATRMYTHPIYTEEQFDREV